MKEVEVLMRKLRRITVAEACWLLFLYGHKHDEVYWQSRTDGYSCWTTPYEFDLDESADTDFAISVRVRYQGGPRGRERFYWGNLVTLVVDRILLAYQTRRIGFAWLLGFDNCSTLHIKDQLKGRTPDTLLQRTFFNDERDGHYEPVTMCDREHDDLPFDNPVVDYVQIGDNIYPIHEDGTQGRVVQRAGKPIPIRAAKDATNADDGTVYLWSSSGRTGVSAGSSGVVC